MIRTKVACLKNSYLKLNCPVSLKVIYSLFYIVVDLLNGWATNSICLFQPGLIKTARCGDAEPNGRHPESMFDRNRSKKDCIFVYPKCKVFGTLELIKGYELILSKVFHNIIKRA